MHKDGWQQLLKLCSQSQSEAELDAILNLLLTIEERDALAARLLIVKALLKGDKTQREISKELGVSIAKITRGSNALKTLDPDLKEFLIKQLLSR